MTFNSNGRQDRRICLAIGAAVAVFIGGCGVKSNYEQIERGYDDVDRHAKEIEKAAAPD